MFLTKIIFHYQKCNGLVHSWQWDHKISFLKHLLNIWLKSLDISKCANNNPSSVVFCHFSFCQLIRIMNSCFHLWTCLMKTWIMTRLTDMSLSRAMFCKFVEILFSHWLERADLANLQLQTQTYCDNLSFLTFP